MTITATSPPAPASPGMIIIVFVRPAFRYTASRYCNVELYYFYRNNASTVRTSAFNDTQVGVSVNFKF